MARFSVPIITLSFHSDQNLGIIYAIIVPHAAVTLRYLKIFMSRGGHFFFSIDFRRHDKKRAPLSTPRFALNLSCYVLMSDRVSQKILCRALALIPRSRYTNVIVECGSLGLAGVRKREFGARQRDTKRASLDWKGNFELMPLQMMQQMSSDSNCSYCSYYGYIKVIEVLYIF